MILKQNLLEKLTVFDNKNDFLLFFDEELRKAQGAYVLSFLNAHAFNISFKNKDFKRSLMKSNLLLRDGVGIKLALTIHGVNPGLNMNGTDLIPILINRVKGKIALYGTREPNLGDAVRIIEARGVEVVCYMNGFKNELDYVNSVLKNKPDVVLLGMGMPKQEFVAEILHSVIDWPCLIINGGAILDFMSGRVVRAPAYVRSMGLEWLFRLFFEPRRLWRRYVIGNFLFIFRVIIERFFNRY